MTSKGIERDATFIARCAYMRINRLRKLRKRKTVETRVRKGEYAIVTDTELRIASAPEALISWRSEKHIYFSRAQSY